VNHDVGPAPADQSFEVTDYDYALYIVLDGRVDYIAQLAAIRDLLRHQKEAEQSLKEKIAEADSFARRSTGILNEQAIDDYICHVQASIFQDAAHSMAAVGMLAPLVESLFDQSFAGIRQMVETRSLPLNQGHPRWHWPTATRQWDCHYFCDGRRPSKGLANGILELAEAVGLSAHLPHDLKSVLQALFTYRNNMFHCGFEWPIEKRRKFNNQKAKWPSDWFSIASSDNKPWIFYVSDMMIEHCLERIDRVLRGIGAFARGLSKRS
jgi:hypothetical protein